jgi:hypothetical protein
MAAARARGGGGCGCGRRRGRKLRRSGSSRAQRWWSRGDILAPHRVGLELAWVGQGSQRKRMTARGKNGPSRCRGWKRGRRRADIWFKIEKQLILVFHANCYLLESQDQYFSKYYHTRGVDKIYHTHWAKN